MRLIRTSLWLPFLLLAVACESTTEPSTGAVTVTVATTGDDLDADGYTVAIGTDERALAVNGSETFSDIGVGAQSVTLAGIADNCASTPTSPQSIRVVGGETVTGTFTVLCEAIPNDMRLVAADRDGNVYLVDEVTGV